MPSSVAIARITHSRHLIEIVGQRILTDPWFSSTATYRPGEPVSLDLAGLPALDGV